jgi:hypothetical protein
MLLMRNPHILANSSDPVLETAAEYLIKLQAPLQLVPGTLF